MPIARQPDLGKALRFRARLTGEYVIGLDGVYLSKLKGDSAEIQAGETRHITLDCEVALIKNSMAYVQVNPVLWRMGTVTGPLILTDKHNTIDLRLEADVDIDLAELEYVVKLLFEGI